MNEIMDISQIKSGSFDLKAEALSLSGLMEEAVAAILPDVQDKNLELVVHSMAVEHEHILGDRRRLLQVFLNILENAVRYTPAGGRIEVEVTEHESTEHGCSSYDFVFRDNGIGIGAEFIPHIFEPFSREEDSRISKIEGSPKLRIRIHTGGKRAVKIPNVFSPEDTEEIFRAIQKRRPSVEIIRLEPPGGKSGGTEPEHKESKEHSEHD